MRGRSTCRNGPIGDDVTRWGVNTLGVIVCLQEFFYPKLEAIFLDEIMRVGCKEVTVDDVVRFMTRLYFAKRPQHSGHRRSSSH